MSCPARGKKEARRRKKELGRAGYLTFTQTYAPL
jgi:hypothetical protein